MQVSINDNILTIVSNEAWSCRVDGNFTLSSYNGNGNGEIVILKESSSPLANGMIYFSSKECNKITQVAVSYNNLCHISTIPQYVECNGEKMIQFDFILPNEAFFVYLTSYGSWEAKSTNASAFINDNTVMITTSNKSGKVVLSREDCDSTITVYLNKVVNS